LSAVRKEFGDIMLMADANSAYTLSQLDLLKQIDEFGLLMLEQPLANDDIVDHAKLQKILKTKICLDESIESLEDARKAIDLGSMQTINIKVARVGGLTEAKKIHDLCKVKGIPVWCGGMLDTGIGRAHNIAIASLPNYSFPGDIPASDRYYAEDFMCDPVHINKAAMIQVPVRNGIGMEPVERLLDAFTFEKNEFLP
jgi:L-alanine-DL-glutamate epimerase and related enzymes of enolase superfamily